MDIHPDMSQIFRGTGMRIKIILPQPVMKDQVGGRIRPRQVARHPGQTFLPRETGRSIKQLVLLQMKGPRDGSHRVQPFRQQIVVDGLPGKTSHFELSAVDDQLGFGAYRPQKRLVGNQMVQPDRRRIGFNRKSPRDQTVRKYQMSVRITVQTGMSARLLHQPVPVGCDTLLVEETQAFLRPEKKGRRKQYPQD